MDCKESVKEYCRNLGLNLIGFTKCRIFHELIPGLTKRKNENRQNEFEDKDINKRVDPFQYMKEGKTIISIAFPYLFNLGHKHDVYFSKYTQGRDYHTVVNEYLQKICNFIQSKGYRAEYFVDSNNLPERYIAYLCGIGFIGKNNMLITEKYGSYVFLGEIITDMETDEDEPMECKCEECNICLRACPTSSLEHKDPNICLSYITQKKNIEDDWFNKLKGRMFGCDTCQRVCPYNKNINTSNIEGFKTFDFMENLDLEELIYVNNKEFKEKYKLTSCGWRGKSILQRNALINCITMNKDVDIQGKNIKSPYVLDYYHRLLKK
ncbi:TPA: tRNA epoxyqueuosine(34) reductase QueG [Clostridium botulinum]|uniref:tRNA epoxyqueuosine(34) reductase QueG n=1 Tax=Clostridium botulinum TaxID=1491 RepID=UPI000D0D1D06|nr:tRNA epoxyqueuosine(34) reductase QueG [Clostridium botulinum]PSM03850.1 tRNA epoxyqueuosine(34) reductase QueG [Clostridium botulinum]HDK7139297.1 tRNA epoxyqueuosine(34) reductase QueG [Clostridium botulinum]HDK7142918.1 tRNA epoxyqueuosine(34) reductase QueG [Clostridium botulinum]HDK7145712.1 tRNA epoxyqueuosine(34) reductase QueG [Clostridium botulinum]HDK7149363.1 tRNA epoxyqueuosine(34) reductase QueG [Clostridium botulinum]